MKSNIFERYYIECNCGCSDHLLQFDFDEEYKDVTVCFVSNYKLVWYKRLLIAIKYVLFREYFCCYDSVIISEKNIEQLEIVIKTIKEKVK